MLGTKQEALLFNPLELQSNKLINFNKNNLTNKVNLRGSKVNDLSPALDFVGFY